MIAGEKSIALVTNLDDLDGEDPYRNEYNNRFKHLSALPIENLGTWSRRRRGV